MIVMGILATLRCKILEDAAPDLLRQMSLVVVLTYAGGDNFDLNIQCLCRCST